jgi:HK97 family phage major capsid protein
METLEEVLARIDARLAQQQGGDAPPPQDEARSGSRYVAPGADPDFVKRVAEGGAYNIAEPKGAPNGGRRTLTAFMAKALAEGTGSAGGFLVPPEYAEGVLAMIRARAAVMAMGPRVVPVRKQMNLVSLASGATAYWVLENARITPSEQTFAEAALLIPKALTGLVPVSNQLLRDAENPSVDEVVRTDLAEVLALRFDLAALRGTGTGGEPLGIRNVAGLTAAPSLGANGATPDFDTLKNMVANLRAVNAPFLRPGWVFHPRTLNTLEKLKDGQGRYLAETGLLTFDPTGGGGTLLGLPFRTTTQIPTNLTVGTSNDATEIYLSSDWQELWVGEERTLTIDASAEASYSSDGTTWSSAYQQRQTLFRAEWMVDLAPRRPALFSVMTGVRP